jgi:hypothetical protein
MRLNLTDSALNQSVPETMLVEVHRHCTLNSDEIASSTLCGCFYFLGVFASAEGTDWIDDSVHGATKKKAYSSTRP